jgi:hypothetical protein
VRDGRDECNGLARAVSVMCAMRMLNSSVLRALASDDIDAALEAARALSRLLDDPTLTRLDASPDDC